jgi:hypothetical protein
VIVRTLWYSGALLGVSGIVIGLMRIAWIRASLGSSTSDVMRSPTLPPSSVDCVGV